MGRHPALFMELLLPHPSFKVPDLILLQVLGSFQGCDQAKPPLTGGKRQPMRSLQISPVGQGLEKILERTDAGKWSIFRIERTPDMN
jgi:hypothetical protein